MTLAQLDIELGHNKEIFEHYRGECNLQRPPIWAACETMSFGLLSRFYENTMADKVRKTFVPTFFAGPERPKLWIP